MSGASLNTFQPENAAHGADMIVTALGPGGAGQYVTIAEIFEMDFDIDNQVELMPVLGSRRTGARWGRIKVTGAIKSYWYNGGSHSLWFGAVQPSQSGSASAIYHSAIPFQRYNIRVTLSAAANPAVINVPMVFVNVVFEKDVGKWTSEKFTEETINFVAEDVFQG